jgi:hypothetical protein
VLRASACLAWTLSRVDDSVWRAATTVLIEYGGFMDAYLICLSAVLISHSLSSDS